MHQKYANGSNLLDLRVLKGGLQVGKSSGLLEQGKNKVAVQPTNLDQNAKEADPLKFFKEHHWVFA